MHQAQEKNKAKWNFQIIPEPPAEDEIREE